MAGPKIYHKVNQLKHKTTSRHKKKCAEVKIELHAEYKIFLETLYPNKIRLFWTHWTHAARICKYVTGIKYNLSVFYLNRVSVCVKEGGYEK